MKKVTTLLPTTFNDGSEVPQETMQNILQSLWDTFGGLTVEGMVEGHWIDQADNQHYQDRSLKVTILMEPEKLETAKAMVREIRETLKQVCMYFEVNDVDFELL
ncbi:MAG: hypothetical protein QM811_22565 [Pirellulales bacterium]